MASGYTEKFYGSANSNLTKLQWKFEDLIVIYLRRLNCTVGTHPKKSLIFIDLRPKDFLLIELMFISISCYNCSSNIAEMRRVGGLAICVSHPLQVR